MRRRTLSIIVSLGVLTAVLGGCAQHGGILETDALPAHLADRGEGAPTSMFATYCRRGEFLVYPFFEYYTNEDEEYAPEEFGYGLDEDFRGEYEARESLIFLCYGITEDVNLEVEVAVHIEATQEKAVDDPTAMPAKITESGLGDVQTQLNWRWKRETEDSPEVFSYFEIVYPFQEDEVLIGTTDWEFKFGTGIMKGSPWGTLVGRLAMEFDGAEDAFELGEYAVEYVKKLSPNWRVYLGVEGSADEMELITEVQWHVGKKAFIKLNNAFGLTSNAPDWAPEVGIMFAF